MTSFPSPEVLARFQIQNVVSALGGRFNQHWLVESKGNRFVLRRWAYGIEQAKYETRLLTEIAALGWPVTVPGEGPIPVAEGGMSAGPPVWSLAPFLQGQPRGVKNTPEEQRHRGRLLAEFHASLARLPALPQRPGWRRCETILADPGLDALLFAKEHERPEDIAILRHYLDEARRRLEGIELPSRPHQLIHGDFTHWNLLFEDGRLSGVLDFELAHLDHRVAEFANSWRGLYDDVILAYDEVAPLEPEEWSMIVPVWWAQLLEGICQNLRAGTWDDGWTVTKIQSRSALFEKGALG